MSNFWLKIIAVVTMLIDHAGFLLFDNLVALRIIGRLAFPIYAFLLTEGYKKTSNKKKYLLRIGLFALISEIPFNLALFYSPSTLSGYSLSQTYISQNIYFTLFIGLLAIMIYEYFIDKHIKEYAMSTLIGAFLIATFAMTDYGWYGIAMIFIFHLYKKGNIKLIIGLLIINSLMAFVGRDYIQSFSLLALFPIFYYNGNKGYSSKWLQYAFYAFYPLHLLVLFLFK
ncbi:MAG: TraX protein [Clostridiales bacterium]|jgi:hypothetical protein|nr:TraX protein [Clostridiales bacterium]